jgi:DNA repair protein RadD
VGLLDQVGALLPALPGNSMNPAELYVGENLEKLLLAFLPADSFASSEFRARALDRLTQKELWACAAAVGVPTSGAGADDFGLVRDRIAGTQWTKAFAAAFVRYFDLPSHFLPASRSRSRAVVNFVPPTPEAPIEVSRPYRPLKDYQSSVFWKARDELEPRCARFVVLMPTGAGKTRTAVELVADFLNQHSEAVLVIWLAHAAELCDQAMEAFVETWPHVGQQPLAACRAWGGHDPEIPADRSAFVVSSFQKMRSFLESGSRLPMLPSLIVVDEAHMTMAPTYRDVVQSLLGTETRVMGLTATPARSSEEGTVALAEFYFNRLVEISTGPGEDVKELLTRKRVLALATYTPLVTGIHIELTAADEKYIAQYLDLPPRVLRQLGRESMRNIEILRIVADRCSAGHHVLVFACSVEHSKFLTSMLLFMGIKAAHLDGGTGPTRRSEITKGFRAGTIQVLCNFGVLSTGFDAPCVDVVLIARPTASAVLYSQMVGRGLRGVVLGGTTSCNIVSFLDTWANQELPLEQWGSSLHS